MPTVTIDQVLTDDVKAKKTALETAKAAVLTASTALAVTKDAMEMAEAEYQVAVTAMAAAT